MTTLFRIGLAIIVFCAVGTDVATEPKRVTVEQLVGKNTPAGIYRLDVYVWGIDLCQKRSPGIQAIRTFKQVHYCDPDDHFVADIQEDHDGWESAKTIRLRGAVGKFVEKGKRYRITIERPAKLSKTHPSVRLLKILPEPLGP